MENTKVCTKCLMDNTDRDILFDSMGVCKYCREAETELPKYKFSEEVERNNLKQLASQIKKDKNGQYDSIIGLSGGVDSSYVAFLAKEMGLSPLCVHFDNGWNSETSVRNIKNIIDKCGFDLETYVIDWPEFKDLQRAFFKAGVVDIEMLSDHAIMATMFKLRKQYKIKYVLSGSNYVTEHGMPPSWLWRKYDLANIKSIQNQFGDRKLKDFPTMNSLKYILSYMFGMGGTYVQILNNVNYSKTQAMEVLKREFNWEYYGGKHYESVFTKFYQAYYLPTKFNYDKRKVHLSSLIRNGEITRDQALAELQLPLYSENDLINEKAYVIKKLGFSNDEFDAIMRSEPKSHLHYESDEWMFKIWRIIKKRK